MDFVDTHCHLQFEKYGNRRDAVYADALGAGVNRMICVGTTFADSRQANELAQSKTGIWSAAGVHPHEATEYLKDKKASAQLEELLRSPKVVAVGEIGLDFYKNYAPKIDQEKTFRLQIETALSSGLPFIFHVRDAWSDFWRIFADYKGLHGVVHSFSSGLKQLDAILNHDLYIGLNGIMTFTKDQAQLEAAKQVPLDRILLETDAPFLTPEPFRSQICEPKYIINIAEFLANLRGQSVQELSKKTSDNALKLFNLK